MLTVIPFCSKDIEILVRSCLPSLLDMQDGNFKGHSLVLLPTSADAFGEHSAELKAMDNRCRAFDLFGVSQPMDLAGHRNTACNLAFKRALDIALGLAWLQDGPVFFCEPDVTFIREAPLDCLEEAYLEGGTGVLGHLTQVRGLGLMVNGVAVYGTSAMGEISSRLSNSHSTVYHEEPFDLRCRLDILEHVTPTNLIGQIPATRAVTEGEGYNLYYSPGWPVCWHGVKDGSLWRALKSSRHLWMDTGPPDFPPINPLLSARDKEGVPV